MNELTRRFPVHGVELAWEEWGSGDAFVLCHGFSGSAHDFDLQVGDLAANRRVLALDHRGHGRSTKLGDLAGYSFAQLAADLISLIEHTVGGPVDLLGHSMGGRVALEVVLTRPDLVRSLILMDTSAWSFLPPDDDRSELIRGFLAGFDPAGGLPDLGLENPEDALIEQTTPASWQAEKEALSAGFDPYAMKALGSALFAEDVSVRDRLHEITCPVTVIAGALDHPFVDQAADLAAEVKEGRCVIIEGAYHSPQLTHAAEWRRVVEEHLAASSR
jgi:pimeloyl-ACP methyl ester carboxylesterase